MRNVGIRATAAIRQLKALAEQQEPSVWAPHVPVQQPVQIGKTPQHAHTDQAHRGSALRKTFSGIANALPYSAPNASSWQNHVAHVFAASCDTLERSHGCDQKRCRHPIPSPDDFGDPTIVWELGIEFKILPSHSRHALEAMALEASLKQAPCCPHD